MKVTVFGGGNIGTQFAVHAAAKGHESKIYTSKPQLFSKKLSIISPDEGRNLEGEAVATDDLALACDADVIFITLPAFCIKQTAQKMLSYVKRGTKIGLIPGTGGGECAFKDFLQKDCVIFGLQRVPSVARLIEYGKSVKATGYRGKLHVSALPNARANECAALMQELFDIPCETLSEYLSLTLTPSNPILHTTRLYSIFKDYKEGKTYPIIPLFYEDWSNEASTLLFACDGELQTLCARLKEFDLSGVISLKTHYESDTPEKLTQKIRSIDGFKGITTPSVSAPNGEFLPDLQSRYFVADFSYGLDIIQQVAEFADLRLPNITKVSGWYQSIAVQKERFSYRDYGIETYRQFVQFYKS